MDEPVFRLEAVYDAEIAPLMDRIIAICQEHGIPMMASFVYENDSDEDHGPRCVTTSLARDGWQPGKMRAAVAFLYRPAPVPSGQGRPS